MDNELAQQKRKFDVEHSKQQMIDAGRSSFLNDKKADAMINAPISNEMPIVEEMADSNSFVDQ